MSLWIITTLRWPALKLIQAGCFMASVDLKDAYYSIPVHPEHRKYLMFKWEGQYYQFTCLPNGLSSAPRVFTKILKPVYSHLRSIGHICMGHIDDSLLLVAYSLGSCRKNIYDTVNLFTLLGFTIHPVKSVLEPTQTIQFLGFVIDSVAMTVKLPPSKAAKVKSACQNVSIFPVGHLYRCWFSRHYNQHQSLVMLLCFLVVVVLLLVGLS